MSEAFKPMGASIHVGGGELPGLALYSAAPYSLLVLLLGCSGVSGIFSAGFGCLCLSGLLALSSFSSSLLAGSVACLLHLLSVSPGSPPVLMEVHTMKIVAHTLSFFGCLMMGVSPVTPSCLRFFFLLL